MEFIIDWRQPAPSFYRIEPKQLANPTFSLHAILFPISRLFNLRLDTNFHFLVLEIRHGTRYQSPT